MIMAVPPFNPNPTGCIDAGDTAWVSLCSILVLTMIPALAFFESGLLRVKNSLSIYAQILSGVIICSVLWNMFGYSLVFGPDHGGIIGDFSHAFLTDVPYNECSSYAPTIPAALFVLFQMMFAVISPLLMTGSFAERLKFKAALAIIISWEILVHYPLAHWIWGHGGWLQSLGVLDFAGGLVIHTSSGTSALVISMLIRTRKDFDKYQGNFPHSNLFMSTLGAVLLWIGWFGFNSGSAFRADSVAVSALISTQLSSSVSGLTWLLLSWYEHKPSVSELLNGCIAGMAGITPASGYIDSNYSMLMGLIFGLSSFFFAKFIKGKRIDDALDVTSIHGLTGLIGSLCIGFLSDPSIAPASETSPGLFYGGGGKLLGLQVLGAVVSIVYPAIVTYGIVFLLRKIMGPLEVSVEDEVRGLDIAEHHTNVYTRGHGSVHHNDPADAGGYHAADEQSLLMHNRTISHSISSSLVENPDPLRFSYDSMGSVNFAQHESSTDSIDPTYL